MTTPVSLRKLIKVHELCGIEQIIYWKLKNNSTMLVVVKALSFKEKVSTDFVESSNKI